MRKKLLFLDRDGTLIIEPNDLQVDSFKKLEFYPNVIYFLSKIANQLNYQLVMVSNQDGLGTESFKDENFWPIQNFIINTFKSQSIFFKACHIDRTTPEQKAPTRKPNTAMLEPYLNSNEYDLQNSYVIGDRLTDVELAKNLNAKAILIKRSQTNGINELTRSISELKKTISLITSDWEEIYYHLKKNQRKSTLTRQTNETKITIELNLNGTGQNCINTGLAFFNHMLMQIAKHGQIDLFIEANADLHVDSHHCIEDVAITLGQALKEALGKKIGIERYGYTLPMDDCLAHLAIDLSSRSWLVWEVSFNDQPIGGIESEMFFHFFKSFTDSAELNLNVKALGKNQHHKIEAIFKAFGKALKMAIRQTDSTQIPSTKNKL